MCPPRTGFSFFLNMSGVTLAAASGPATDQRQQQQPKKRVRQQFSVSMGRPAGERDPSFPYLAQSSTHVHFSIFLKRKFHPLFSLPFHAARNGQHGRRLFARRQQCPASQGRTFF